METLAQTASAVREIGSALKLPFRLQNHWTIQSYAIDTNVVTVTLTVYATRESVRETRFVKKGTRMMAWTRADETSRWQYQEFTVWDTDFVPFTQHQIGKIESPAEYRARRQWEGDVYRPGSDRSPMDSAARAVEYSPMTNYWNK